MAFKAEVLDIKKELVEATRALHKDVIYNPKIEGLVNRLMDRMRSIDKHKAKGSAIWSRVKWKHVGNNCSRQFFQVVRKNNFKSTILELRNEREEVVNQKDELEYICFEFQSTQK